MRLEPFGGAMSGAGRLLDFAAESSRCLLRVRQVAAAYLHSAGT